MRDIIQVEDGIWILEENGRNVLLKDCQKYGIGRETRKSLFDILSTIASFLAQGKILDPLIQNEVLKKLTRQEKAGEESIWEIREKGRGGRLLFVMRKPDSIIVAAVDKNRGSLSQAINRGANRWKNFLKKQEKSLLLKHWG